MALIGAILAVLLAWIGQGRPLAPAWALAFLPVIFFSAGVALEKRVFSALGFFGLASLAMACTFHGDLAIGLGVLCLALFTWDCLPVHRFPSSERPKFFGGSRAWLWSGGVVGTGLALAFAISFVRFSVNFWALVGAAFLAWFTLRTIVRELVHGGKANGNRS